MLSALCAVLAEAMAKAPKVFDVSFAIVANLIGERANPRSPWKAYLDTLPQNYDIPLFWPRAELEELQGSNIVADTSKDLAELKDFSDKVLQALIVDNGEVFRDRKSVV